MQETLDWHRTTVYCVCVQLVTASADKSRARRVQAGLRLRFRRLFHARLDYWTPRLSSPASSTALLSTTTNSLFHSSTPHHHHHHHHLLLRLRPPSRLPARRKYKYRLPFPTPRALDFSFARTSLSSLSLLCAWPARSIHFTALPSPLSSLVFWPRHCPCSGHGRIQR